jgi:RHS repeat-associated protein
VVQSRIPSGPPADPNLTFTDLYSKQYGRVNYTYGLALDRPLSIRREFFGRDSTQFNKVDVFPHYTWKGEPAGHTSTAGTTDPAVTDVDWPVQGAKAYGELFKMTPKGWFGSQIIDRREESGLQYMRNRYYNPTTGRFTQEDPIGLAGGLNLYGFAGGDPVNFADPFGLCPAGDMTCELLKLAAGYVGGTVGASVGGAIGGVAGLACGPAAEICSPLAAGFAADALGSLAAMGARELVDVYFAKKPTSPGAMQKQVERRQAPRSVDRVDPGNPRDPGDREPHIHFKDMKAALRRDGVWKEVSKNEQVRQLTKEEIKWIQSNNWQLPK